MSELTIKRERLIELTRAAIKDAPVAASQIETLLAAARRTPAIQIGTSGGRRPRGGGGPGCVSAQAFGGAVLFGFASLLDGLIQEEIPASGRKVNCVYPTIKVVD